MVSAPICVVLRPDTPVVLRAPTCVSVKPLTWVLWFGPFALLIVAAIFLGVYLRQRRALAAPAALSDEERERAKQLLKD